MTIDLVYLWVDGSDPVWRAKKNQYLPKDQQLSEDVAGDCRYIQRDELKFSLRSAEKFVPWINHIYIVTDGQVPKWLNLDSPKISIIDHKDIIPAEYLPTFNSSVIEFFIHNIKGLSERFLFSNDDTMFGRPLEPSFFFYPDGEPIVRLSKSRAKGNDSYYRKLIYRMQLEVEKRSGKFFEYVPHHNIDAYRKSDFEAISKEFSVDIANFAKNRFRTDNDMQRSIIAYWILAKSSHPYRLSSRYNGAINKFQRVKQFFTGKFLTDSRCFPLSVDNIEKRFNRYNPALFAINDEVQASEEQRGNAMRFMQNLLLDKSLFEL